MTPFRTSPHWQDFGIGDAERRHPESALGIEARVDRTEPDAGVVDRAEPSPFEKLAQLEHAADRGKRRCVARVGNDTVILILYLAPVFGDLLEKHPDRLEHVERLEASDHDGTAIVARL